MTEPKTQEAYKTHTQFGNVIFQMVILAGHSYISEQEASRDESSTNAV